MWQYSSVYSTIAVIVFCVGLLVTTATGLQETNSTSLKNTTEVEDQLQVNITLNTTDNTTAAVEQKNQSAISNKITDLNTTVAVPTTTQNLESYKFGYDPIAREHQDDWHDTMYILHPNDLFVHRGHITAWHIFANSTGQVTFTLWRPGCAKGSTLGTCLHKFQLIAKHSAVIPGVGSQIISLVRDDWMTFWEGDLIGMYFPNVNPIPFTKRQNCSLKTMYIQEPGELHMCQSYIFRQKQDGWNPCRMYSIYAEIIHADIKHSSDCPAPALEEALPDEETENTPMLPEKLEIKLMNGRLPHEGLVMVRSAGTEEPWGTICDDGWDNADATVVCRQLGYRAGLAMYPPYFGHGWPSSSPIYLDNVNCTAIEQTLRDCLSQKSWRNNNCQHTEDAGVECLHDINDDVHMFGYPAINRAFTDGWLSGVYIPSPHQQLPWNHAYLTRWNFYIKEVQGKLVDLSLQVWRMQSSDSFRLVGSTEFKGLSSGAYSRDIPPEKYIQVQAGDVLGIRFSGSNPIPYDVITSQCPDVQQVLFMVGDTDNLAVGHLYEFTQKPMRWMSCRIYSLSALYKPSDQKPPLKTSYTFTNGLSQYKVIMDKSLTRAEADKACREDKELGPNAGLVNINSENQFMLINGVLNSLGIVFDEMWISGYVTRGILYSKWGSCEPARGHECIVVQKTWDGQNFDMDAYHMFARSCNKEYRFICQNASTSGFFDHPLNFVNINNCCKGPGSGIIALVVLAVLAILLVFAITALFIYRKYRRHRDDEDLYSESTVRFVHLDEKAAL